MKTIILYATKYGATAEIAMRLAEKIGDAVVQDLKLPIPELTEYDCIIIGSSVYTGMFHKEAKTFLLSNTEKLKNKKIGLYASGMSKSEADKVFADNIPTELLQSANTAMLLGGIFDPKKANFIERLIMKVVTKQSGYIEALDNEKITTFSEVMKSL
ncbi:MAG: flavodoxin domain-containing protein [Oscillospiraceae bacterium]|jgi:menaquinone-dependent protoporphyrinogen oxidase|nr:flavodoxin domain-containing protein [Oscillospiraceae bacterium]